MNVLFWSNGSFLIEWFNLQFSGSGGPRDPIRTQCRSVRSVSEWGWPSGLRSQNGQTVRFWFFSSASGLAIVMIKKRERERERESSRFVFFTHTRSGGLKRVSKHGTSNDLSFQFGFNSVCSRATWDWGGLNHITICARCFHFTPALSWIQNSSLYIARSVCFGQHRTRRGAREAKNSVHNRKTKMARIRFCENKIV